MKKKIILDIIMTVIFIILMKIFFTGVLLHEVIGLVIFLMFILHKYWNWTFIKKTTKNILIGKVNPRVLINYLLDWMLFIDTVLIIISGILISQELFPFLNASNISLWSAWHHFFAYVGLILIGLHIGLHFNTIMIQLKKMLHIKKEFSNNVKRAIAALLLLLGTKAIYDSKMIVYLKKPFNKNSFVQSLSSHTSYAIQKYTANDSPTLEEYLGNLFCNGCGRHCPLSAPQCGIGARLAEQSIVDYQVKYASASDQSASTSTSSSDTTTSDTNAATDAVDNSNSVMHDNIDNETSEVIKEEVPSSNYLNIVGIISFFGVIGNFIRKKIK